MKWTVRQASYEKIEMLHEKYNIDLVASKILSARNVFEPDEVKFWLENDVSFLHNPFLFEDMNIFCERVFQAVEDNEKVRVFGDRDVDGITSTALLVQELERLGLNTTWTVPMNDDPYGVTKQNIDEAVNDGVTLAITVDCGISCFDEIEYAKSKGLDFLVTDHHLPGEYLPPACAIIDPKIEGCGYPFRDLAGVGVVAKCIWALRFAKTSLYNEQIILLHSYPGNGTVIIEAVKLENLMVAERISEEIVPGTLHESNSRLLRFLDCAVPVAVLDKEEELIQLKKVFPKAEINLVSLREKFDSDLPFVRGKSLFSLNSVSRFALYSNVKSELDTLTGLFCAWVRTINPLLYKQYITIMDLVAIGTVSDLMPMTDENRILVRNGLKVLETTRRESLIPFLGKRNLLDHKLSTTDISWQISPYLNASGRLGKPDIAIEMLLSSDRFIAENYADQLLELNNERQKLGEIAWEKILPKAQKNFDKSGSKLVMVFDETIPRGITGIISTRLQKTFKAPSVVITKTSDGRCIGSMRSQEGFSCYEFLTFFSSVLDDFGGHDYAAGFSLDPEKLEEFQKMVYDHADYIDCPEDKEEDLIIDVCLAKDQLNQEIMKTVERFEPYGEQNNPVVFLAEGAVIDSMTVMANSKDQGNGHLRLLISYGDYKWPAVFWNAGNRALVDFCEKDKVDVVFRMGRNYYKNQETIQLTVLDIRKNQ